LIRRSPKQKVPARHGARTAQAAAPQLSGRCDGTLAGTAVRFVGVTRNVLLA